MLIKIVRDRSKCKMLIKAIRDRKQIKEGTNTKYKQLALSCFDSLPDPEVLNIHKLFP